MRISIKQQLTLALTVLIATLGFFVGCTRTVAPLDIVDSIKNPSLYVMVSKETPIPEKASYSWGPQYFKIKDPQLIDLEAANERFTSAFRRELDKKGYSFVESPEDADILVGYALALDSSIDERDFNASYGKEFEFSFPMLEPDQQRAFHQGALIVDFLDTKAKKLLWRGALVADVDIEVTEQQKDERADAIARVLLGFFPKPEK